ncbi:MAG: hypothetical protein APR63_07680 [Desulfuromonas sp. SDB]|nr:MAG: hypothetical protein APR63_07680 [Desulfuromonas sp. SDB]
MNRYLKILLSVSHKNFQDFVADRVNFFTYFFTIVLYNALNIIFLKVVFSYIPVINGWSFYELLFIFGYFTIVTGLFYMLFSWCLWFPNSYIIRGKLDLIRQYPINPLFYITVLELGNSIMEINSVVLGIAVLTYSWFKLCLNFDVFIFFKLIISLTGSFLLISSYFLFFSAVSFKIKSTAFMGTPFMEIVQFSQYPVSIYAHWLRFVLIYIIPVSFIAFFPSASILRAGHYGVFHLITLLVGLGLFYFSVKFWFYNLRRYESVGN